MDHSALHVFEQGFEDIANITTAGRMGTAIYRTLKNNSSTACLRRGQDILWETMDVLRQDTDVIPENECDTLCKRHDELQAEGRDIEKLLEQPFKLKHLVTGRALKVKRRAGMFEDNTVILQARTKRTSATYRSQKIQKRTQNQAEIDAAAERTIVGNDAHDHRTDEGNLPDVPNVPLSGDENSPLPGDPNTPPSVVKDLDFPSLTDENIISPKHTYPPDAHKSV